MTDSEQSVSATARGRFAAEYQRLTGRRHRSLVIEDPQGIRAIAHAARQQVIDVLYGQGHAYTSTELSTLTGLSPSAMSYHLRALEKWGVVERAPVDGDADARNRPWQAAADDIEIRGRGVAGSAAAGVWIENNLSALRDRLAYQRTLPEADRRRYRGLSDGIWWLDAEQTERLNGLVERFQLELLAEGWRNEPGPDRTAVHALFSVLPEPPASSDALDDPSWR